MGMNQSKTIYYDDDPCVVRDKNGRYLGHTGQLPPENPTNQDSITTIIGFEATGKTTLFNILCGIEQSDTYKSTLPGTLSHINGDENKTIYDNSGKFDETYNAITAELYTSHANVVIIVVSPDHINSLKSIKFFSQIQMNIPHQVIVVYNKCDITEERSFTPNDLEIECKKYLENKSYKIFEVSLLKDIGVEPLLNEIHQAI